MYCCSTLDSANHSSPACLQVGVSQCAREGSQVDEGLNQVQR